MDTSIFNLLCSVDLSGANALCVGAFGFLCAAGWTLMWVMLGEWQSEGHEEIVAEVEATLDSWVWDLLVDLESQEGEQNWERLEPIGGFSFERSVWNGYDEEVDFEEELTNFDFDLLLLRGNRLEMERVLADNQWAIQNTADRMALAG